MPIWLYLKCESVSGDFSFFVDAEHGCNRVFPIREVLKGLSPDCYLYTVVVFCIVITPVVTLAFSASLKWNYFFVQIQFGVDKIDCNKVINVKEFLPIFISASANYYEFLVLVIRLNQMSSFLVFFTNIFFDFKFSAYKFILAIP